MNKLTNPLFCRDVLKQTSRIYSAPSFMKLPLNRVNLTSVILSFSVRNLSKYLFTRTSISFGGGCLSLVPTWTWGPSLMTSYAGRKYKRLQKSFKGNPDLIISMKPQYNTQCTWASLRQPYVHLKVNSTKLGYSTYCELAKNLWLQV